MNLEAFVLCTVILANLTFTVLALFGARRAGAVNQLRSPRALLALTAGICVQMILAATFREPGTLVITLAAVTVSAVTDAGTGYIFDAVTLPALVLILAVAFFSHHSSSAAATGALAAGGPLILLYAITLGRGLGLGDVKLACCIGAGLGARDALLSLALAFVIGGAYAALLLITRRGSRGDEMRFAPYMAAGVLALCLYRVEV